jgi:hypothetical protein
MSKYQMGQVGNLTDSSHPLPVKEEEVNRWDIQTNVGSSHYISLGSMPLFQTPRLRLFGNDCHTCYPINFHGLQTSLYDSNQEALVGGFQLLRQPIGKMQGDCFTSHHTLR